MDGETPKEKERAREEKTRINRRKETNFAFAVDINRLFYFLLIPLLTNACRIHNGVVVVPLFLPLLSPFLFICFFRLD